MNGMGNWQTGQIAALVLAAGYSSRMGDFKPLLEVGGVPAIERVVGLFRRAGVGRVTVVLGHRADELKGVVEDLGATALINPDFDQGMFSSIKVGLRSLAGQCEGCLLLPVDIPLVRPATVRILCRSFFHRRPPVLYPLFNGQRGHPPLISGALFPEILEDEGAGGLCSILARHAADANGIPVYDEGIRRDMDTPEDYAALRFAAERGDCPSEAECEAILADLQPNAAVLAHMRQVAAVAVRLAADLVAAGVDLDRDLVLAGSLLHDIAKGHPDHAMAGASMIDQLGYPDVAGVVACHSDLDFSSGRLDERAVVFLADKLVQGSRVVPLEDRFQKTRARLAEDVEGLRAAEGRLQTAKAIRQTMEVRLGCSLEKILAAFSNVSPGVEERGGTASVLLGTTESVCPVCLRKLPAERLQEGDVIYLRKCCPEHGAFKTATWRGAASYHAWGGSPAAFKAPTFPATKMAAGCPFDCGLCADHRQESCCVLIEVTGRCNLACPVCFAGAGSQGRDLDKVEIERRLDALRQSGRQVNIQLSGGEPTLRDDLPEIVAMIRAKGLAFVQVNTNGIRLARDEAYVRRLKEAGLDCVFLQFDGLTDDVYRRIRGADLFDLKVRAIDICAKYGIGVVLVPVLVPGVNLTQVGDIIRFAAARSPQVRTVHFQPISYFGRYPGPPGDEDRVTIPEVLRAIEDQMGGSVKLSDFRPGTAENPYCSFNGDFMVGEDGGLRSSVSTKASSCCGGGDDQAERARRFVARRWATIEEGCCQTSDVALAGPVGQTARTDSLDAFLASRSRTLCISGMAFQDAWTLDLDRLRQCYIHVATGGGRLVPLCAANLSGMDGKVLYPREAI